MSRADADKNKLKVAKELLKNPLQTEREIVESTWLGKWTVHRQKKELEKNGAKDDRIKGLLDWDMEILQIIQSQKKERLAGKDVSNRDIDTWENTANKRRIMFGEKDEWDDDKPIIIQI